MFFDWNRNGRIDPIDIGIQSASQGAANGNPIQLSGYHFQFVQELVPERTILGKIKTFDPKVDYPKRHCTPLNKYGEGPFCRFSLNDPSYSRAHGVYALFDDDNLLYIGKTVNLLQRYNNGYGNIQPVNCYVGGQSTNCKINAMILQKYQSKKHVYLFFCETNDYDAIEQELITALHPPYNAQHAELFQKHSKRPASAQTAKNTFPTTGHKEEFEEIWKRIIQYQGEYFTTVTGIAFLYKVSGSLLLPLHITSAVPKESFIKAYQLGSIRSVAHLRENNIAMPSYVYAIMTDERIRSPRMQPVAFENNKMPDCKWDNLCVGDRVLHHTFGGGVVKEIRHLNMDAVITVNFDTVGEKRLMARISKLEKL